jgi:hypothetical protein
MLPRRLAAASAASISVVLLATPGPGQACARTFGPMGASIRPSEVVAYDQFWSVPARIGTGWRIAWCEGNDIHARAFDLGLAPLGPSFLVNTTYNLDTQDEPAICGSTGGNYLIAWSERHGYDGSGMGIMGRVYDPTNTPLGPEFVVNQITFASQWRPLISPTPSGGWVVAWSGDNDGNAYVRLLDSSGGFLTGDLELNTFTYDAQVDPAAAAAPNGTIFAAFVDFSSHGGSTGLDLYGRTLDASGSFLQPQEFLLTSWATNGDQRDPRVAADGQGRFYVVWSDQLVDGSGYGICERVFDPSGNPIAPEFQVNTTATGDQLRPVIVADALGRTLVAWEDDSLGAASPKIRGRRFDELGNPAGPDFVLNDNPGVGTVQPNLAMDPTGTDVALGFQGPGAPGDGVDVYARRFRWTDGPQIYCVAKVNSRGCTPMIRFSGTPSASSPNPFTISATRVLNHQLTLMLYGHDSAFTPFQGSVLCVAAPLKRWAIQSSGGNPAGSDCSGVPSTDFNARIRSGADPTLVPGATVTARWIYRDGQDPAGFGTGLTDALRFAICP